MNRPELLAPVNGPDGLHPALAAGADAVYLGLKGFNARAKARNFTPDELAAAVRDCRRAGCRVHVTFNTLLFDGEWERAATAAGAAWEAGADALIVQDPGAVGRLRRWLPDFELHASTQMTVHHPSQLAPLAGAGIARVILARELSLDETAAMARAAGELGIGVESFVHGALCVSYSGQCLISAFTEKRSGNRGLCAQICRRGFQTCVAGKRGKAGKRSLPLSMRDLSALPLLPELVDAGVVSLKIEGRLKRSEYVAGVVAVYREALDRIAAGVAGPFPDLEERLRLVYNRGFSLGGLGGEFAAEWTTGRWGGPRFLRVGTVRGVDRRRARLRVEIGKAPEPGDGLALFPSEGSVPFACVVTRLFDGGDGDRWIGIKPLDGGMEGCPERGELFLSSSASELRRIRESIARWEVPALPLRVRVSGGRGEPLAIEAALPDGRRAEAVSSLCLEPAGSRPLTVRTLEEQLGRLGNTAYRLESVDWPSREDLFLPKSELNALRRELVENLDRLRHEKRPLPGRFEEEECADYDPVTNAHCAVTEAHCAKVTGSYSAHFSRLAVFCDPPTAALLSSDFVGRVYVPFEAVLEQGLPELPGDLRPWPALPPVTSFRLFDTFRTWLEKQKDDVEGILAGHAGVAALARERSIPFAADTSFNITNATACDETARLGACSAALSWEVSASRAAAITSRTSLPVETVLFGRPPMMQTGLRDLALPSQPQELVGENGQAYPVKPWPFAAGFTLEAPFFRAAPGAVESLRRKAAFLRLDVRGLDGEAARLVVECFSRVLEDPASAPAAGDALRKRFGVGDTLFEG